MKLRADDEFLASKVEKMLSWDTFYNQVKWLENIEKFTVF